MVALHVMDKDELIEKLLNILVCFIDNEGTLYETYWSLYNVNAEQAEEINRLVNERYEAEGRS